jgi:hypothetical protein
VRAPPTSLSVPDWRHWLALSRPSSALSRPACVLRLCYCAPPVQSLRVRTLADLSNSDRNTGGAARRWAETHRRPVRQAASTSYSAQNRPRPPSTAPSAPCGSNQELLPFFVAIGRPSSSSLCAK